MKTIKSLKVNFSTTATIKGDVEWDGKSAKGNLVVEVEGKVEAEGKGRLGIPGKASMNLDVSTKGDFEFDQVTQEEITKVQKLFTEEQVKEMIEKSVEKALSQFIRV